MARNRRSKSRHVPVHKESRTRLVWDETPRDKGDKDNGKFYKCWNCGQICHDKEHALGGPNSGDSITFSDFYTESKGIVPGNEQSAYSILVHVLKGSGRLIASPKQGSDGVTKAVVHNFSATGSGCPLCFSKNYAGFYP